MAPLYYPDPSKINLQGSPGIQLFIYLFNECVHECVQRQGEDALCVILKNTGHILQDRVSNCFGVCQLGQAVSKQPPGTTSFPTAGITRILHSAQCFIHGFWA